MVAAGTGPRYKTTKFSGKNDIFAAPIRTKGKGSGAQGHVGKALKGQKPACKYLVSGITRMGVGKAAAVHSATDRGVL